MLITTRPLFHSRACWAHKKTGMMALFETRASAICIGVQADGGEPGPQGPTQCERRPLLSGRRKPHRSELIGIVLVPVYPTERCASRTIPSAWKSDWNRPRRPAASQSKQTRMALIRSRPPTQGGRSNPKSRVHSCCGIRHDPTTAPAHVHETMGKAEEQVDTSLSSALRRARPSHGKR